MNNSNCVSSIKLNEKKNKDKNSLNSDMEAYYKESVEPFLSEIEADNIKDRSSYRKNLWSYLVTALFLVCLFSAWGFFIYIENTNDENLIFFLIFFLIFIFIPFFVQILLALPFASYSRYKKKIIPILIKYCGVDSFYSTSSPKEENNLHLLRILSYYDYETNEFYLQGKYKNVAFTMTMTEQYIKKTKDKTVTVFKGVIFEFIPKKKFSGITIVGRNGKELGVDTKILSKVNLEDPDFNRVFKVNAGNQIEARTLLTASFMQRLLTLEKKLNSKIDCCFCAGSFLIRVPCYRNYFSIDRKNLRKDFKTVIRDVQIILDIVDGLKLDLDIGL
jgi:uncharacterized protein YxeA